MESYRHRTALHPIAVGTLRDSVSGYSVKGELRSQYALAFGCIRPSDTHYKSVICAYPFSTYAGWTKPQVTGMRVRIALGYQPFAPWCRQSPADRRGLPCEDARRRLGACQPQVDGFTLQPRVRV